MPVDGDVRRNEAASQAFDEGGDVIGLVGAQRDPPFALAAVAVDQRQCVIAPRGAGRLAHATQHGQAVAVLQQGMADISKASPAGRIRQRARPKRPVSGSQTIERLSCKIEFSFQLFHNASDALCGTVY